VVQLVGGEAIAQPPDDVLAPRQRKAIEEIDVEGVPILVEERLAVMRAVVVELQGRVGIGTEGTLPPGEHVAAAQLGMLVDRLAPGGCVLREVLRLASAPLVKVAFNGEQVVLHLTVAAKAAVQHLPVVVATAAGGGGAAVTVEVFAVDAIVPIGSER